MDERNYKQKNLKALLIMDSWNKERLRGLTNGRPHNQSEGTTGSADTTDLSSGCSYSLPFPPLFPAPLSPPSAPPMPPPAPPLCEACGATPRNA